MSPIGATVSAIRESTSWQDEVEKKWMTSESHAQTFGGGSGMSGAVATRDNRDSKRQGSQGGTVQTSMDPESTKKRWSKLSPYCTRQSSVYSVTCTHEHAAWKEDDTGTVINSHAHKRRPPTQTAARNGI